METDRREPAANDAAGHKPTPNKPRRRRGLRLQVTSWLVLYATLLSLAVFLHGYIVNEQAE